MRFNGAAGGILATPGTVDADARRHARHAIELIDGDALWPLLKPLLPPSVRDAAAQPSRTHAAVRYVVLAWLAALVLGVRRCLADRRRASSRRRLRQASAAAATRSPRQVRAATSASPAAAPRSARTSSAHASQPQCPTCPGSNARCGRRGRRCWSTSTTSRRRPAQGHLRGRGTYDDLRASRLQLQPPPGSQRAVRFLQCQVY